MVGGAAAHRQARVQEQDLLWQSEGVVKYLDAINDILRVTDDEGKELTKLPAINVPPCRPWLIDDPLTDDPATRPQTQPYGVQTYSSV